MAAAAAAAAAAAVEEEENKVNRFRELESTWQMQKKTERNVRRDIRHTISCEACITMTIVCGSALKNMEP